jgi:hypothetical protein
MHQLVQPLDAAYNLAQLVNADKQDAEDMVQAYVRALHRGIQSIQLVRAIGRPAETNAFRGLRYTQKTFSWSLLS